MCKQSSIQTSHSTFQVAREDHDNNDDEDTGKRPAFDSPDLTQSELFGDIIINKISKTELYGHKATETLGSIPCWIELSNCNGFRRGPPAKI